MCFLMRNSETKGNWKEVQILSLKLYYLLCHFPSQIVGDRTERQGNNNGLSKSLRKYSDLKMLISFIHELKLLVHCTWN